jgi:hypothetical protein
MVYYLGTECEAPLTGPWTESSPGFYVSEPRECEQAVRHHLPFPCVRYLGARTGCGCGFRRDYGGFVDVDSEKTATAADHTALAEYLRALPPQTRPMQIYGCWSGDESEPSEHFRTCTIEDLESPEFGFRERELITVVSSWHTP